MFQAGCSEKDLSQLWRAGRFCGVREECLPVVFLNELCPHNLTSQRRFLTLSPCKKPHKLNKKSPNNKTTSTKNSTHQETGWKPPRTPLSISKNTSDSCLNKQTEGTMGTGHDMLVPLSLPIQWSLSCRTEHIPLEVLWEHRKESRSQGQQFGIFTKTMRSTITVRKVLEVKVSLPLQQNSCIKHFLPKWGVICLARNRAERNRLNYSQNNRSQET